jgi:xanthine/CO dehydrogenase XdhC/CoxF family maturation factor
MNSASEFARLLAGMRELEAVDFAHRAALATIVRTHGSTFRRAGASMLVRDDDRVVCALSGGCPERDIIARAKNVIVSERVEIARYNDASAGDVLFEAGCGGELDVLIEPLTQPADIQFLNILAQMHTQRRAGFLATIFARDTLALQRPLRLIWNGAVAWSNMTDAQLAEAILAAGMNMPVTAQAVLRNVASEQGNLEVLYEPVQPVPALIVVGVNPVALALAECTQRLGWKTLLVDDRELSVTLPSATFFVKTTPATVLSNVPVDAYTSAAVMTFNVERDIEWLQALAQAPLAYLGAIGSRERAARMRGELAGRTVLHAPAGLDIGSETPEEIALAVSAEILAVLNTRQGASLSRSTQPIHP